MRNIFTLSLMIIAFSSASAQTTGKISGSVMDGSAKRLQSATVSLLKAKDSSLVKLAVTDKAGQYEFLNIKAGKYLLSVTSVGFSKKFSDEFEINGNDITAPDLVINQRSKDLNEVTVTAKKPFIETKIDKTIVNVDASPSNAGATALEVLEKSPGISVDNDGNISLKGKAGVIVMMDGKPTYLSATDLANMLKNMPASALDQIEIMTNPSAKYDASGNSGIINIRTKKGKAAGFNGSITLGGTISIYNGDGNTYLTPKSQNSFNFNYKKKKINLFGNYNPNFFQGRNILTLNRKLIDPNGTLEGYVDQLTHFKFGNNNHTLKLGIDYYADKKNILGAVASGFVFSGHPSPVTVTDTKDPNGQLENRMISTTNNRIEFKNFTGNLNWKHLFDTAGRELTADFDYVKYNNVSRMTLTTDFFDQGGQISNEPLFLKGYLPSNIDIYSFKSDYSHPLKNGTFEAGVKSSYVTNDNQVDYQRQLQDKSWVSDSRSNHFIYDENINAAYVNINRKFKKFSVQLGLRLENTIAKGHQVTNDSTFRRNFTNLFPTSYFSYELNKNNQLTLSYGRRINRPNYQDLNPFTYFLDTLTYRVGNPYLLPQFTNNFELSYSFKSKYIATVNYTATTDVISQVLRQNIEKKITYNTSENVASFKNIGLALTIPGTLTKWWNFNLFTNIFNNHYSGIYDTKPIDLDYSSFMINLTNSFTLSKAKGLTGELSGFYRYKNVDQLAVIQPFGQMSIALQKQVLQGKGTLRLNVRDPFAWQKFRGLTAYSNIYVQFFARPDLRQVTATFTYRFG
ncbi:MAG: outer membrane beta-barrel protein, partial [Flavisolibacter sp.]